MAVHFTGDSGKTLLIGGQSTLTGAAGGGVGPFPRYSISREDITAADGTYLNSKFIINVTGTAVINSADNQDITTRGERQSAIQGETVVKMRFDRHKFPTNGTGTLSIVPYGGRPNDIVFKDARVTGIELPEQTEESSGIQNLEYNFSFEAYQDASSSNSEGDIALVEPTWLLSSVDESWELSVNDGEASFPVSDISSDTINKVYSLTHTVSATGLRKSTGAGALAPDTEEDLDADPAVAGSTGGAAWRQAVTWVTTRLMDDPNEAIVTDLVGNASTSFHPFHMDKDKENVGVDLTEDSDYIAYNHVRSISSNIAEGSYSVTDTWAVSEGEDTLDAETGLVTDVGITKARHEIEINYETAQEDDVTTVTVSGTVIGFETGNSASNLITKYANALIELDKIFVDPGGDNAGETKLWKVANIVYKASGGDGGESGAGTDGDPIVSTGTLNTTEVSKSLGHNKVGGTITYNVTYSDAECTLQTLEEIDDPDNPGQKKEVAVDVEGCISQEISITDDNEDGLNEIIAIFEIIGKTDGPVIQDMNSSRIKKRSVAIDIVMDKENRASKPDGNYTANLHKPSSGYRISKMETWSPTTGAYNLSIEWEYV